MSFETSQKHRLLEIFERLLPLVDSLADKLLLVLILGVLSVIWLVVWFFHLKHFSLLVTAVIAVAGLIPTLVLARFWWAITELKKLPEITGEMVGDAKTEFQASVQAIRAGNTPKLGFLSAGKSLWSIGSMSSELKEIVGSYLSIATLVNPLMLVMGAISFVGVFLFFILGIILAFFI